jgi:glycyl-tRNA synthetase beta chain
MTMLLIEIGCEELPYKVCESVIRQLEGTADGGLVYKLLAGERLLPGEHDGEAQAAAPTAAEFAADLRVLVSPRRIAVLVDRVPERQRPLVQEFRGPRADIAFGEDGALTKAGAGFARSRGADARDVRRETLDGTEFACVRVEAARKLAIDVLPPLVGRLIGGLQIPRGMRWDKRPAGADDYLRFSRPIRWIVCKLGARTVPGAFYGLEVGDVSQGHRVLGSPIIVDRADHYERHLAEQRVVVSQDERRALILKGLDARAAELGGEWSDPGNVLAEAVYLAEWPSVAGGAIAQSHLRLPDNVLITAMQSHQRYFPVRDADGKLLPAFLYVSNADPGAAGGITRGNERVLGGRLDDAEFAYDRDLAEGLEAMAARLKDVTFHEKLGSLADKAQRLQGLVAGLLAGPGGGAAATGGNGSGGAPDDALRAAARLAKADLVSQVVIEFPSLQGEMGGHYAAHDGLGDVVAVAVGEHYLPLSATAPLPSTFAGALLAVADKADNILGAWVAGEKPSGSRDPYGLRRAAMGMVRIALEYNLRFALDGLLASALDHFELQGSFDGDEARRAALVAETAAFVWERVQALLLDEGLPYPVVEAALGSPAADIPARAARARVFSALAGTDLFEDAVLVYNRCASLASKDAAAGSRSVDPALFALDAERELAAVVEQAREPLAHELARLELESALKIAAGLRPAVDRYFEDVLVMDKDERVRANRLAQLAAVANLVRQLGEFSRLPVTQA